MSKQEEAVGQLSAEQAISQALEQVSKVIRGKDEQLKKSLACVFSGGHILFEDLPGTGKTSLAQALSKVLGLDYSRVQFTSDLLPSDVVGSTIFDQESSSFSFQKGPVFTQLLLADEINRTTPKTQSSLLEAMAEQQVTVNGEAYPLDQPFFVIATQNPQTQFGTFALPESQLDRFMISLSLGYPDFESEKSLLKGETGREKLSQLSACFSPVSIQRIKSQVNQVHLSDSLVDYILRLVIQTREHAQLEYGISPRGALALSSVSKAWAFIHGRDYVIPEDVQALLLNTWQHRLVHAASSSLEARAIIHRLLDETPVNL